jgi:phage I-like protein
METRKNILILSDTSDTLALAPVGFSDGEKTPPDEFLLIRYGDNDYTKGEERGKFVFSEADADEIISDFSQRGKDIVFDYEHQTLKGTEAPASGWIRSIAKGAEGLVAKVDWTERAKKFLQGREYRYHSPVLHFKSGRPYRLHSVALTNHPALHGYPALVADDNKPNKQEETMNEHLKKIAAMLGVTVVALADGKEDEKATAEAVEAKVKALSDAGKNLQDLLSLHDCKTAEELTLKIKGMVPAAEKQQLEEKLAGIEAEKAVAKAFSDGKLIEAQREWAVALAKKDLKAFCDYAEKAPKVAPGPAATVPAGTPPKTEATLAMSDNEKGIFQKLGLTDEQINKIKEGK